MTWNYRVVKYKDPDKQGVAFGVHEIYYDDENRPRAMTAEPESRRDLVGDSVEELIRIIDMWQTDVSRFPVLDEKDIIDAELFWGD